MSMLICERGGERVGGNPRREREEKPTTERERAWVPWPDRRQSHTFWISVLVFSFPFREHWTRHTASPEMSNGENGRRRRHSNSRNARDTCFPSRKKIYCSKHMASLMQKNVAKIAKVKTKIKLHSQTLQSGRKTIKTLPFPSSLEIRLKSLTLLCAMRNCKVTSK